MARLNKLAAIALVAAAVAVPAWADTTTAAQEQPAAASSEPATDDVRVFDALVVTGATLDAEDQRWATGSGAKVPEIADSDWVPAPQAPSD